MMKNKYKVLIISCWVLLFVCFIIKLLGGNWFEVATDNTRFIEFCNWLDTNWLKYVFATIIYVPSSYLVYCCLTKQKLGKDWWLLIALLPGAILKWTIPVVGFIIEFIYMLVIPLIKGKFKNWLWVLIGIALTFLFQYISLLTRNIGFINANTSMLVGFILQIDYYIMICLYYLYIRKGKEEK